VNTIHKNFSAALSNFTMCESWYVQTNGYYYNKAIKLQCNSAIFLTPGNRD